MCADPCYAVAGKLLEALHLPEENHRVFRENIATYVAQLRDDFVDRLQQRSGDSLVRELTHAWPYGDKRWGDKLERDVEKPYSDQEVSDHLKALQDEMREKMKDLFARNPQAFPMKLYVSGSLVKGRFGANSDLDLLLDCGDQRVKEAGHSYTDNVHIQYLAGGHPRWRENFIAAFGEKIEVDPRQALSDPGLLKDIYAEAMEKKGYALSGNRWSLQKNVTHGKEIPPPNGAGIAWSFADLPG